MKAPLPDNETARLKVLCQYKILDTAPEEAFDDCTTLAAQICETPIASISLIDEKRIWLKSKIGLTFTEVDRKNSFCSHTILQKEVLVVQDTLADERFAPNPLVTASGPIRFYAGVPLINSQGYALGTLFVMDSMPRELKHSQIEGLQALSRLVITQLELRTKLADLIQVEQESKQLEVKRHLRDQKIIDFLENGTTGMHCVDASPLKDGLCVYFSDSTKLKQAEQKIREQAALLDIVTEAIFVQDLDNKIQFWNKGAEQLYGWTVEEVIGKESRKLLYQEKNLTQLPEIQETIAVEGQWCGELHQLTKNNKEIIAQSRWTQVKNEEEKSNLTLVVNTDITKNKHLEAQFLRAQRLESIGTLAGGIAHDLNNVLAPILMAIQLLSLKVNDEQSQQWLEILETNAKRGADLVKQVVSFARGIEGERTLIQVRHLISEIRQIARETFPKHIEIYIDASEDLWTVHGDVTQLHQVLMNLCVNARDALPEGGSIRISADNIFIDEHYAKTHMDAKVGAYIALAISDTGTGIPAAILERIFEPFFTTKEIGKGTGLGLYTALSIIKSHGGFINVYSEVGQGAQFKVYLPALEEPESPIFAESEFPTGQGELILLVDDETAIRQITQISLETYGYTVMEACDGIEAIALYAQHKAEINLVLVDMMMPNMDGLTTIRTLQRLEPQVKIVAVSGLVATDKLVQVATLGVKTFLSKPYTTKELLQSISELLRTCPQP